MSSLASGARLNVTEELVSDNGLYRLVMQTDGHLVLYSGPPAVANAVWGTNTWNLPDVLRPNRAEMQADGNFVLYSAFNVPAWSTGTHGNPGARLYLQDDRNLVIYDQTGRTPLWSSATDIPGPGPRPGSITATKNDEVGWAKRMETTSTLYRDGRLVVDSYTRCDHPFGGLRGRTLVVVVDGQGRSIWVSQVFEDPTRCSLFDVSCASYGRVTHSEQFPAVIGQYAERLDIYHADNPNFLDLRNVLIDGIRATADVAQEVIAVWNQLQK